jgi:hypothetical protein
MNLQKLNEIKIDIVNGKSPYYVYLLLKPDGTPFYVGKGKSNRITAHEAETRYFLNGKKWRGMNTLKINTIAKLWEENQQVYYKIDSWHETSKEAGLREIELVSEFGKKITESGTLTNIRDGGDILSEEDRRIIGERLRQYYIDHPEARDHLSDVLANYCIENPWFIENLQKCKNEWILNCPDEYEEAERKRLEICSSDSHREKVSNIMKDYFANNPDELERIKSVGASYWENNPEAVEQARQNSLNNNTAQKLIDWYSSEDEEVVKARMEKYKSHAEFLVEWNETDEGKEKTKKAAIKRNETVRTAEHRAHMASKTADYIKNNPEADKLRRAKAAETKRIKSEARQIKLLQLQDELFAAGKIKRKRDKISYSTLRDWKKAGFLNSDFTK